MRLVNEPINGYNPDLRTNYTAWNYEHDGHSIEVILDNYGYHIRIDGKIDKTKFNRSQHDIFLIMLSNFGR